MIILASDNYHMRPNFFKSDYVLGAMMEQISSITVSINLITRPFRRKNSTFKTLKTFNVVGYIYIYIYICS